MVKDSILLLGATGFLGSYLREELGDSAIWTGRRDIVATGRYFDVRTSSLTDLVSELPKIPSAAVILFGETRIDECARNPGITAHVNVSGSIKAIDELRNMGIVPVFISSDAVFSGNGSWWGERDSPSPILTYGKQKREVEQYLEGLPPPWMAIRLPKLLSHRQDRRCILTNWVDQLGQLEPIRCATDQYFTPACVKDISQAIAMLIEDRMQGLIHLGGPQRISRRELLGYVIEEYQKFKVVSAHIVDCSLDEIDFYEARPHDTSMSSEKFDRKYPGFFRSASSIAKSAVESCIESSDGHH